MNGEQPARVPDRIDRGAAGTGAERRSIELPAPPPRLRPGRAVCGSPAGPSVDTWGWSPGWRRASGSSSCCHCLGANSASACRRATWRQSYRTRCPGGAAGPDKRTGEATALEFGGLFSPRPVDWMPGIERPPIRADIRPIAALLDQLLAVQNLLTSPRWGTTWSQSIARLDNAALEAEFAERVLRVANVPIMYPRKGRSKMELPWTKREIIDAVIAEYEPPRARAPAFFNMMKPFMRLALGRSEGRAAPHVEHALWQFIRRVWTALRDGRDPNAAYEVPLDDEEPLTTDEQLANLMSPSRREFKRLLDEIDEQLRARRV